MSDFDKEAERQKLREKFDRDREKRKETERMSQLLLQGATMTNRHCDTCGDPLFRYQGQVFCATCEGRKQEAEADANATADAAQQEQGAAADTTADADASAGADAGADVTPTGGDAGGTQVPDSEVNALDADAVGHPAPRETRGGESDDADRTATDGTESEPSPAATDADAATPGETRRATPVGAATTDDDSLAAAHASLVRTLTHHAQQAEAADGPRRATEHLTAVREAAEALAALERGR